MSEQKRICTIWGLPQCGLTKFIINRLVDQGVDVEIKLIDGFLVTWAQFKEVSPTWSNLPAITLPDGSLLKNVKDVDAWLGPYDPKEFGRFV